MPDIYIKKQINLSLLLLLKLFLPGLTEIFLKSCVLEIEDKRAGIILYEQETTLKMRGLISGPVLYLLFVLGQVSSLS